MNRFQLFSTLAGVAAISVVVVSLAFADTGEKPAAKKLTGQELYAINCGRCHSERYATERTPAQWKTLMLHMRTRAQIPAAQAKEILKYLQEDAGK